MAWNDRLAYELLLRDGQVLRTLYDVVDVFASEDFNDLAHARALKSALDPVLHGAMSGHPDDLKAATDQVATVLRIWRMMA